MIDKELSERIEALALSDELSGLNAVKQRAADLRALLTAAQGQEWRPIAEAPRDGKRIVIFGPVTYNDWGDEKTTVPFVHEAYFANDLWQSRGGVGHPTHWRPLPPPPNPSAVEG